MGAQGGQLFLDDAVLGVDVVVLHDFSVGGLVVQLICSFGQGVKLVTRGREEVGEPDLYWFCGG